MQASSSADAILLLVRENGRQVRRRRPPGSLIGLG